MKIKQDQGDHQLTHARRTLVLTALAGLFPSSMGVAAPLGATQEPWMTLVGLLRQGQCALLLRHAVTEPGIGDPPQFTLGQCQTQRNLSAQGRQQARNLGERMRALQLQPVRVLSSPWCRCVDTATIAFGSAQTWEPLGSFFTQREQGAAYARSMREGLAQIQPGQFEVWVTHMVNIEALTGQYASSGEGLIARIDRDAAAANSVRVMGRWPV